MIKNCSTCKHNPVDEHCKGCKGEKDGNTHWEPEELDFSTPKQEDTNCKFCHEDRDGYVFPLEKNCHVLVRLGMNGWVLSVKYGTWRKNIQINYCPMCGRRLKHE